MALFLLKSCHSRSYLCMKSLPCKYTPSCVALMILVFSGCKIATREPDQRPTLTQPSNWNNLAMWTTNRNSESSGTLLQEISDGQTPVLRLDFRLGGDHGYVELTHSLPSPLPLKTPIAFRFKAEGGQQLELKLVDSDGSVNGTVIPLGPQHHDWTQVVLTILNTEYWWGGRDCDVSNIAAFQVAVSPKGSGALWLDMIGPVSADTPSTLPQGGATPDPDCDLPGFGFKQRRDSDMKPLDPLVVEWLRLMQDSFSPEKQLIPSNEDNEAQTFNNALCAMAFMLLGERERAERILDFYAAATRRDNEDATLQNFFYRGEPRGFFQSVALRTEGHDRAYHTRAPVDRWMGDMAWLLFAYKYHERLYGPDRYEEIRRLIFDLILSWYTDSPDGRGGYVQHGWRKGDSKLHESFGHQEGNLDAYAVMKLFGRDDLAAKIQAWLEPALCGKALPLDLYTWRVLAFGREVGHVLSIPECDLRYRKTMEFNGRTVIGFYHQADLTVTNVWLDGVGHIACAYFAAGDEARGNFYANQLDSMIIRREIHGQTVHALPYTLNSSGPYDWVDTNKGFSSVAAWYIFAKYRFNPMTLETY